MKARMDGAAPGRTKSSLNRRDIMRAVPFLSFTKAFPTGAKPAASLKLVSIKGGLNLQWKTEFENLVRPPLRVDIMQATSLQEVFDSISAASDSRYLASLQELIGKKRNAASLASQAWSADAVTLGDAWMGEAIRRDLIQPMEGAEHSSWFNSLHPRWKALLRRDVNGHLDPRGAVFGAPYRWGCTLMAYRTDKCEQFGGPPRDWDDLLRPQLKGRIGFVESPREFVGAGLKTLGLPYNFDDLNTLRSCRDSNAAGKETLDIARERIKVLRQQVRFFDSKKYLQALGEGDIWVAVGWSSEVIPFAERTSKVELACPLSGTSLWADVWCVPKGAQGGSGQVGPSPLLDRWIDFNLQPSRADQSGSIRQGGSPLVLGKATQLACPGDLPRNGREKRPGMHRGVVPHPEIIGRSEFLLPLSETAIAQYHHMLSS